MSDERKKILLPEEAREETRTVHAMQSAEAVRISAGLPPVKRVPIKSKRWVCSLCNMPLIEDTPVIPRSANPAYLKHDKRYFEAHLRCPNGCEKRHGFKAQNMRT